MKYDAISWSNECPLLISLEIKGKSGIFFCLAFYTLECHWYPHASHWSGKKIWGDIWEKCNKTYYDWEIYAESIQRSSSTWEMLKWDVGFWSDGPRLRVHSFSRCMWRNLYLMVSRRSNFTIHPILAESKSGAITARQKTFALAKDHRRVSCGFLIWRW